MLSEMFPAWNPAQPEITDLIVQHDPHTLQRLLVRKQDLLEAYSRFHNRKALRAILALPENAGYLDAREIDVLLLTVHWEMQRLAEEFHHGHRVWELLRPVVASIRQAGIRETLRIIDLLKPIALPLPRACRASFCMAMPSLLNTPATYSYRPV